MHTLRAAAKTGIRRAVRARGYDVVPLGVGLPAYQRQLMHRCGSVIDVGANVGQFAERVRDLGFRGTVISFEPEASAFEIMKAKADADAGWEPRRLALGAEPGRATLRVTGNSVSSSLLDVTPAHVRADPNSATVRTAQVEVSTLDAQFVDNAAADSCGAVPTPYYLKLDVQGFELAVLHGGPQTLSRALAVQAEVSFDALYENQSGWLDVCAFLLQHGFAVRYLEQGFEAPTSGEMLQADFIFVRDSERPTDG